MKETVLRLKDINYSERKTRRRSFSKSKTEGSSGMNESKDVDENCYIKSEIKK